MTEFSPSQDFRDFQKDSLAELQSHSDKKWLRVSLEYALAQTAAGGSSAEALLGARAFVHNLLNLCEPSSQPPPYPKKSLTTFN